LKPVLFNVYGNYFHKISTKILTEKLPMNTTHFKVKLRTDLPKKDGTCSLFLYANINGKRLFFSLHKSILEKFWNPDKQEVRVGCKDWQHINDTIKDYLNKANSYVLTANIAGRPVCQSELEDILRSEPYDKNDFFAFAENDIKEFGSKFAPATIANYNVQLKKLREFQGKLTFQEFTAFFWRRYENHLQLKGNNPNTIYKAYKTLKVFINRAIEQGIIDRNPMKDARVRPSEGKMVFLTRDEIKKLEKLNNGFLTKDIKNVLHYFLFACYTGLRYSDIKDLKFEHVFDSTYIEKVMCKTDTTINIPLSNRANRLIGKGVLPKMKVFRVYSNQYTDRKLKEIMKLAGINKSISFHCARHTFATITLELSGDVAALQKLMGHSKISTTMIYAKVVNTQKNKVIQQWDAVGF